MSKEPYLTVKQTALELGISQDGVRKLIRRNKLKAIRRSERNILVPRFCLDAYLRKINGEQVQPLGRVASVGSLADRLQDFKQETGQDAAAWLLDWVQGELIDDTASNMALAADAFGLVAEQRTNLN